MECDMSIDWVMHTSARPGWPAPLLEEVFWNGQRYEALTDTGSSITMVRATIIPDGLPLVRTANITCFHGHTEQCLVVQIILRYGGRDHLVEVARVQRLPYAFLMG